MTRLVLERQFEPSLHRKDVIDMARSGAWCFEQHGIEWLGSMLGDGGRSMVCQFESGDVESLRLALRTLDADSSVLWPATVHEVPDAGPPNVIVERSFDEACDLEKLQAQEDSKQWCLDMHGVTFSRTLFSHDRKRMLCLYSGPDADAVRVAQREAGMPIERVWSFEWLGVADVAT